MKTLLLPLLLLLSLSAAAQEGRSPAIDFLRDRGSDLGVEAGDLTDLRVTDEYASPSGVRHVYLGQYLQGIPIWNAQAAVHYRANEVIHHTSRLLAGVRQRANLGSPSLSAREALRLTGAHPSARLDTAELVYFPLPDSDALRLSWRLVVENVDSAVHTLLMIDAVNGRTLYTAPLTINCHFDPQQHEGAAAGAKPVGKATLAGKSLSAGDGSLYHVFPFGIESPYDGDRRLVFEPSDPEASPYGWHDTDGRPGAEYTITRGNNVYAYRDADTTSNVPDPGFVADGGAELDFDFDFNPPQTPESVVPASLTQLFYTSNMLHDWVYRHGFDEAAGNFQVSSYGRGGKGSDPVLAETHDNSGSNNANFYTPADGRSPRMQMYLWRNSSVVTITRPAALAGDLPSGGALFGRQITANPIVGEVALGQDGSDSPNLGCATLVNTEEVRGKVVMLTRGDCTFQQKAYNAERAGAIGVLICNTSNDLLTMAGAGNPNEIPVTIPAALLRKKDCDKMVSALSTGQTVEVALQDNDLTPLDGSFDSGVVAHEYGHGISNRLVGGPARVECLLNTEQMGEGWSDFFALASTPRSANDRPTGVEKRGIGVYSLAGSPAARGFRTQFYSTDFRINDRTYDDIILAAVPHGVGETWASVLWDVYWGFVEAYGFDDDLIAGSGGNNAAVRLVIEAMKYTPCSPGMLDGRDALLKADQIENGGANHCMLWKIFQRRGMGPAADQGSSQRSNDGREAFDIVPECIATVKLIKMVDSTTIDPGSPLTYTLTVRNDKPDTVTGITVTDELPAGLTLDGGSVAGAERYTAESNLLKFQVDELAPSSQVTLTYTVTTDARMRSHRLFFAGAESDTDRMSMTSATGDFPWVRTDTFPYAGRHAYYVPDRPSAQDHSLLLSEPVLISGERPALRFYTKYDTEPAYDAGVVQISTDGMQWEDIDRNFLRHDYRGQVSNQAPRSLQGAGSFWGNSKEYREVIVDLNAYRDRSIYVRWRFLSDAAVGERGWWVDNIELLGDLVSYDGRATLTTEQGDRDTSRVAALGVVVNSEEAPNATRNSLPVNPSVSIAPNPTGSATWLKLTAAAAGPARLQLYSVTGQQLQSSTVDLTAGPNAFELPVDHLSPGTYTLRLIEAAATTSLKLVVSN